MADVVFDEEPQYARVQSIVLPSSTGNVSKTVQKLGLSKTREGTERALLVIAFICIVIIILVLVFKPSYGHGRSNVPVGSPIIHAPPRMK